MPPQFGRQLLFTNAGPRSNRRIWTPPSLPPVGCYSVAEPLGSARIVGRTEKRRKRRSRFRNCSDRASGLFASGRASASSSVPLSGGGALRGSGRSAALKSKRVRCSGLHPSSFDQQGSFERQRSLGRRTGCHRLLFVGSGDVAPLWPGRSQPLHSRALVWGRLRRAAVQHRAGAVGRRPSLM